MLQGCIISAQRPIITLDHPLCANSVPTNYDIYWDGEGGLGLLLPWSLTNSGLWPQAPDIDTHYCHTGNVFTHYGHRVSPFSILCDLQEHSIYKIVGQRPIPNRPNLQKEAKFWRSGTGTQCQCQSAKTQLLSAGLGD